MSEAEEHSKTFAAEHEGFIAALEQIRRGTRPAKRGEGEARLPRKEMQRIAKEALDASPRIMAEWRDWERAFGFYAAKVDEFNRKFFPSFHSYAEEDARRLGEILNNLGRTVNGHHLFYPSSKYSKQYEPHRFASRYEEGLTEMIKALSHVLEKCGWAMMFERNHELEEATLKRRNARLGQRLRELEAELERKDRVIDRLLVDKGSS